MIETTIPESVNKQFSSASQASQGVIDTARSGANLSGMLREAVADRFTNSPLNPAREQAAQQVLTSAPRARADVASMVQAGARGEAGGQILSPTQQQSIIAGRRAADVVPLMTLNDLIQNRAGDIDTAVAGGLSGFQTLLGAEQAGAALQQQQSESALSRFLSEQDLKLKASADARAGGEGSVLAQLLAQMQNQGQGEQAGPNPEFVSVASQYAPDNAAKLHIQQNPGMSLVSVQGMDEELPVYAPEGQVMVNDDGSYSVIYENGQWQPYQEDTKEKNWLQKIFGG